MSSSSNISQSAYSPSEPETPQNTPQNRTQNFDQSLSHGDLGHSIEQSLKNAQKEMHQKRIQSLRKELDYLKSTEWKFEYDKDVDEQFDKENYLAEQLLELEYNEERIESMTNVDSEIEIPRNTECIERTGVITYHGENYVLIDGMLYFDLSACSLNLSENDKVLYLGYKDANESIIVVRILQNLGVSWGFEEDTEENKFEVIEHVLIGEVNERENRFVYIKDSDLKFNLDNVEGTFVPVKGDWLEMKCKIKQDENKLSDISTKQVLEVISFHPLRAKVKHATVTHWDGDNGTCDRVIYFSSDCLQSVVEMKVGTKVIVEAIESSQVMCTWRAIKMLVTDTNIKQEDSNNVTSDHEISLNLEKEKKIEMTCSIVFENLNINQSEIKQLNITNNSNEIYTLNKWIMLSKRRDSQIVVKPFLTNPTKLHPSKTITLTITCQPKFLGSTKECLVILFRGFQFKRFIEINIVDDNTIPKYNTSNQLDNKSTSNKMTSLKKIRNGRNGTVVPGVRPVKPPAFISERLGSYPIPEKVWSTILGDSNQTICSSDFDKIIARIETNLPCLYRELNITNYLDRWHTLLFMEEIQENIDIRVHDISNTFLIRCQEYLGIEIKGLSEKRPSIVVGDSVIVKSTFDPNKSQYEGFIHAIKGDLVLLKFNQQFHETYDGGDVSVEFHFSRTTYRRSHQAINSVLSNLGPDVLFPRRVILRQPQVSAEKVKSIKWFNESLNEGQKGAISNILSGECRPLPYVIFGPPGTGKTVTVIETILQILTMIPDSRILVATPSNSASNLVTERLIQYNDSFNGSIVRLIAHYLIDSTNISDEIKPFCATLDLGKEDTFKSRHVIKNNMNLNCSKSLIGRHRVTIGTCYCLGSIIQLGLPRGHFTHIIVDEAGQATEPEIMIPMSLIDKENGQIILAGDPKQLGPVVMSKYCMEFGMAESFLCRLLETFPYQKDYESFQNGFDTRLISRLSDNYRSVKEVLKLPSEMFYDASLVAKVDYSMPWTTKFVNATCDIFDINEERTGGIFIYGINGCNTRAEDSPSWLNPHEASMVALVTCKLYKKDITADEIGIITPYIAQIRYLRLLFDSMGLEQPKIGTVEEFQGQERPIILVTTVRSTNSYIQEDIKHSLGFVKNPRRLNVIITRAQVSAIIFCNPHLLSHDPLWNSVIAYAIKEDKYVGCDLPDSLQKSSPSYKE
ncbi:probable RNA helicase armi [Epargyreus clarus]|uniref:probable RNA helicase armi n=1 Tax=Epargyreus clarus TaxID=520877 RepID=UPI003C308D34